MGQRISLQKIVVMMCLWVYGAQRFHKLLWVFEADSFYVLCQDSKYRSLAILLWSYLLCMRSLLAWGSWVNGWGFRSKSEGRGGE